jgi:hypothetical protein
MSGSIRYSVIYEKALPPGARPSRICLVAFAVGAPRQEAETLIREAIEAHLEALRGYEIPVPVPLHEIGEVEVTAA